MSVFFQFDRLNDCSIYQAALTYARHNWPVFPVSGKIPLVEDWPHRASLDPLQIRDWWLEFTRANVAILTGQPSKLLVVDLDRPSDLQLPDTLCATTGRGRHLYYRLPEGVIIKNNAGRLALGIDIRGENGFVVAPPSTHAVTKVRYQWVIPVHDLVECPADLLDRLNEPLPARVPQDRDQGQDGQPVWGFIPKGRRHDTLFRIGCALRAKGKSEDAIFYELVRQNARRCQPECLTDKQISQIAKSCARYEPAPVPEVDNTPWDPADFQEWSKDVMARARIHT